MSGQGDKAAINFMGMLQGKKEKINLRQKSPLDFLSEKKNADSNKKYISLLDRDNND